jgi:N-acetylglucosamine kinase-like BadF-type ATPase
MPAFDPELTHVMRGALEDVMTRVPMEYSTPATKAHLAEYILKAAAQGHTTYNELVTAAADQIQAIISVFT